MKRSEKALLDWVPWLSGQTPIAPTQTMAKEMHELPIDRGSILLIKGMEVRVIHFGGIGDNRVYVVPVTGTLLWRGQKYHPKHVVGAPLTIKDAERGLAAYAKANKQPSSSLLVTEGLPCSFHIANEDLIAKIEAADVEQDDIFEGHEPFYKFAELSKEHKNITVAWNGDQYNVYFKSPEELAKLCKRGKK